MSRRLIVPFVPTPESVVKRMLTLSSVRPGQLVYDLGAGDGRILSSAVRDFRARAVGVELHPSRFKEIAERFKREGIADSARIIHGDFLEANLRKADVVTLYLLTPANSLLRPKLERELKFGARVVSHDFPIHGWVPLHVEKMREQSNTHLIYVYEAPKSFKRENRSTDMKLKKPDEPTRPRLRIDGLHATRLSRVRSTSNITQGFSDPGASIIEPGGD